MFWGYLGRFLLVVALVAAAYFISLKKPRWGSLVRILYALGVVAFLWLCWFFYHHHHRLPAQPYPGTERMPYQQPGPPSQ